MDASGDLELLSGNHLLFSEHLLSLLPIGENLLHLLHVRHPLPWFPSDN
jgi:hypothetical protein